MEGLNDTAENLLQSIEKGEAEVSPSTLYAVACIKEGVPYINGAPQNTFVPGLIELAVSGCIPAHATIIVYVCKPSFEARIHRPLLPGLRNRAPLSTLLA